MRIRKLEIFGFKSFADRVVINFDQGVTGIVGPNGCGKSNVVDALRWVMGEQNAKHLRGDAMQDIIFSGAQGRNGMGLAEVILTFENDGNLVPPEYAHFSEIEVARRLYKNGDSEYEINKRPCRLRDITELFLGTGIGTKAYSIIEQGRVATLIAAKPEDKRLIIEEAAGITKYKARRQSAERKMASTEQNLMRINDVRKEVESRLGTLERQAKKAAKYHALMDEMRDVDFHHAALQFFNNTSAMRYLSKEKEAVSKILEEKHGDLSSHEHLLLKERERLFEEEKKVSLTKGLLFEAENAIALGKQEILHNDQTVILKNKQELQVHDEMRRLEDKKERLRKDNDTYLAEKETVQAEFEAAEQIGLERAEELKIHADIRISKARAFQELQTRYMQSAQAATKAQGTLQNYESQKAMLADRLAQLENENQLAISQAALISAQFDSKRKDLEDAKVQKEDIDSQLIEKTNVLKSLEQELKQKEHAANELRKGHALTSSRLTSLEEIEQSFEWSSSGIADVMKEANPNDILGLLADFIEVPAELEEAVELALKDKLETILVKSADNAFNIIQTLSEKKKGRLRFLPTNTNRNVEGKEKPTQGTSLAQMVNPIGELGHFVQNILSSTFLVDDLKDISPIISTSNNLWQFVSKSGDFIGSDGVIVGGRAGKTSGVLGRKREIRELTIQLGDIENEQVELSHKISELCVRKDTIAHEIFGLKQIAANLDISLARFEENLRSSKAELQRVELQNNKFATEKENLLQKDSHFNSEIERLRTEWAASLKMHEELEIQVKSEQDNLKNVEADVSQKSEEVTILRVQIAAKKERLTSIERSLYQIERDLKECDAMLLKLADQEKSLKEEQHELGIRNQTVTEKLKNAEKEQVHLASVLAKQTSNYESDLQVLRNKESSISALRSDLDEHKELHNEILIQFERHQMALETLSDRLFEKHRTRPEDVLLEYHDLPIPDFDFDKKSLEIRKSIEQLGAINPTAVEEFEELNERYQFLKTQSDDLKVALSQLDSAIQKINNMTKIRFDEAFNSINQRFSQVFPRLFRGGKAWLELTNPEDLLSSGVEIFAQPPGKKLGSIALMSGGEKALTAISLIFAIFLIKPSPFCLLDEVDAPLDEANVERFSQMVKEMSDISQFIVITHNKRTMEVVDQLYGVTMENPGVSKTVTVRVSDQLEKVGPVEDEPETNETKKSHSYQLELG